jgi:hypothetical protein
MMGGVPQLVGENEFSELFGKTRFFWKINCFLKFGRLQASLEDAGMRN